MWLAFSPAGTLLPAYQGHGARRPQAVAETQARHLILPGPCCRSNGVVYVSSAEHKRYPFTATQVRGPRGGAAAHGLSCGPPASGFATAGTCPATPAHIWSHAAERSQLLASSAGDLALVA